MRCCIRCNKRSLSTACIRDKKFIMTVKQAHVYCISNLEKIFNEYILVLQEDVHELLPELEKLYSTVSTIPGTRSYHCFIPVDEAHIKTKIFASSAEENIHKFCSVVIDDPEPVSGLPTEVPLSNVVPD